MRDSTTTDRCAAVTNRGTGSGHLRTAGKHPSWRLHPTAPDTVPSSSVPLQTGPQGPSRHPSMLLRVLYILHLSSLALAVIVNRTIDDAAGDYVTGRKPTFSPLTAAGYPVWQNQTCTDCAIHPDLARTIGNSYTETTYNPGMGRVSISIPFEGE